MQEERGAEATPAGSAVRRAAASPARASVEEGLRILSPPPGASYLRDPTLRAEFQTLPLRATAGAASGRLTWTVDGRVVGESNADRAIDWPLTIGEHVIRVRDERGLTDESPITVR